MRRQAALFILSGLFSILCVLPGCSSKPDGLVGVWQVVPDGARMAAKELTFKQDGTFLFNDIQGKWELSGENAFTMTFPNNVLPKTLDFKIEGGRLKLSDKQGFVGEYVRKN